MSPDPFPELPDANRLFAKNGVIDAILLLTRLPRFSEFLAVPEGQVAVKLNFGHDEATRRHLTGSLTTRVTQVCQRCLETLQVDLQCSLDILVLDNEEALASLSPDDVLTSDAIVDEGDGPDILAIIEDELILSLPLVALHENDSCNSALNALRQHASDAGKQDKTTGSKSVGKDGGKDGSKSSGKENPFAVLATLKQQIGKTDSTKGNGKQ